MKGKHVEKVDCYMYVEKCILSSFFVSSTGLGTESQPTLMLLTFFPRPFVVDGGNGRLNIIQRTANHYAELAMHLLDDRNGDITAGLEEQFQRNPVKIVTAVYMNWISGTGRKPISWRTLIGVLRDIGLISLAEELETALEHSG